MSISISRRQFVATGVACAGLTATALSAVLLNQPGDRSLSFYVPATGERANVTFWAEGGYLADGLSAANKILRDFKTDVIGSVDVNLLDALHAMLNNEDTNREIEVVRGHMVQDPNAPFTLGSPNSFHNSGQALDLRVPGVTLEHLAMDFIAWVDGGVGMYPQQNFVHLDIGTKRRWIG